MRSTARRMACSLLLLACAPAALRAQTIDYTGAIQASSGDYIFTERTWTWTLSNGLALRTGRFRLSAALPFVVQNSGAVTTVGNRLLPTGGPDHGAVRQRTPGQSVPMGGGQHGGGRGAISRATMQQGTDTVAAPGNYTLSVGDPWLGVGIDLFTGFGFVRAFELTASAKAPLGNAGDGVGTGAWDASLGASLVFRLDRTLLFADASYWWYGDMPDLVLHDGLSYGAAIGQPVSDRLSLLLAWSGSERIIDNVSRYSTATLLGSLRLSDRHGANAGASVGLSEAGADFALHFGWRFRLSRGLVP